MQTTPSDFERIKGVLAVAEEPLTASEILATLEENYSETTFDSTHQLATLLGRRAKAGDITVIAQQPYRYTITDD